jgi:hypothetical protein
VGLILDHLRPHPHRGDVIAAGAVPLALAALLIELRMVQWPLGARFVVVTLIGGLILTMGWLAPLESDAPRPYHSVLLVAGLLPVALGLQLLAELLGATRPPGAGGEFWTFGVFSALAAAVARRANSAICTLIAALAAALAVEAFVSWAFHPVGLGTFRVMLVVLALAFATGAVRLRDPRRRHATQLINAAGLVTLVLAAMFVELALVAPALRVVGGPVLGGPHGAPFGWTLYVLAVGFGLVAYAAVDREPGPGYVGTALLLGFVFMAGFPRPVHGTLVGWPLFLVIIGGAGLAIGLRPRHPLPPPPGGSELAPTVPLRGDHE